MNCDVCRDQLAAWVDGETDDDLNQAIEIHIQECPDCSLIADEHRQFDRQLANLFVSQHTASERVAERVIHQLPFHQIEKAKRISHSSILIWLGFALSMAAGFLLAVVWNHWQAPKIVHVEHVEHEAPQPPVAQLTLVTSPVQVAQEKDSPWMACQALSKIAGGSRIRTGTAQYCEMFTHDQATIRMADDTEVCVDTGGVALESGRLWCCSASLEKPFDVETPNSRVKIVGTCDISHGSGMTEILVLNGEAAIRGVDDTERNIVAPRRVSLSTNSSTETNMGDPIVATSWIHHILARKGATSEEFQQRVNQLLSAIGRAKIDHLYEDELRSLGDSCSEPLSAFILTCPNTSSETRRREKAARILADIAGPNSISRLIGLLDDANGTIRFHVATALQRLTGRNFGAAPNEWPNISKDRQAAIVARWRQWHKTQTSSPKATLDPGYQIPRKMKI